MIRTKCKLLQLKWSHFSSWLHQSKWHGMPETTSGWNAPDMDQRVQVFITRNIGLLLTDSVYGIKNANKEHQVPGNINFSCNSDFNRWLCSISLCKEAEWNRSILQKTWDVRGGWDQSWGGWEMGEQPWQQRQSKLCAGTVHVWDSVMQHHIQSLSRVPWGFSRTVKEMQLNHMSYNRNWWKYYICTAHLHCTIFLV